MEQCGGAAARLTEMELKDLPIFALERSETFTDLAVRRGASFDGTRPVSEPHASLFAMVSKNFRIDRLGLRAAL
jgi:hypothetical protein